MLLMTAAAMDSLVGDTSIPLHAAHKCSYKRVKFLCRFFVLLINFTAILHKDPHSLSWCVVELISTKKRKINVFVLQGGNSDNHTE